MFQAEIIAINKACQLLMDIKSKKVNFFIDSQTVILALANPIITSKVVFDCIKSLNELNKSCDITLSWIKAHKGHLGNELADQQAKQGALSNKDIINVPLSDSVIKDHIKKYMTTIWNKRWQELKTCRQTKIWFPTTDEKNSQLLIKNSRTTYRRTLHYLADHAFLNRHNHLLDTNTAPTCRLCKEKEETSYHTLCECPALWKTQ